MQNQIIKRKNDINHLIMHPATAKRLVNLFGNDEEKAGKFKATIMNVALDNNLRNCSPASVIKSAIDIAEVGLPLAKNLGQAYIVRYRQDAQAVIGYKGWLALAERCGKAVKAKPVFHCDEFSMIDNGWDEVIRLKANFDERQDHDVQWVDNNLKGVLVCIKDFTTGVVTNKFVSKELIFKIASKSPSRNSKYSPYSEWNLEMYTAKAIKYVISKMPMNEIVARAVEVDNERDIQAREDIQQEQLYNHSDDDFASLMNDDEVQDVEELSE